MFHRKTVVTLMTLMDISGRFPLRWPDLDPPTNQLKSGPLQWNRSHCPPSWTSQHRLDVHPAHLRGYADAVWLASRCWYLKIHCQKKRCPKCWYLKIHPFSKDVPLQTIQLGYLHGDMESPGLRQRLQSPPPQIQEIFYAKTPIFLGIYM